MNAEDNISTAADLKALQDDIYREKILRARSQTPEERLADVCQLSNSVFVRMLEGAMWQSDVNDERQGWEIVRQRINRLQKISDVGRFVENPPAA